MNRFWSRLTDLVARALEPDEREAVSGDLLECGIDGAHAVLDVAGLVVRRHAAVWLDWRPWASLLGVVIPLGMLLSLLCRWWSESIAIDAFIYLHNGSWAYLSYPGWRHDVLGAAANMGLDCAALGCWSWATGFAIGSLSKATAWVNASLFVLIVLGELLAVEQHHNPFNLSVFALPFYEGVLPLLLRSMLVLFPALCGARRGRRRSALSLAFATTVTLSVVVLTGLEMRAIQLSAIVGWWRLDGLVYGAGFIQAGWPVRLLPLLLIAPGIYMLATAVAREWTRRVA
jgi:hypothetical protein